MIRILSIILLCNLALNPDRLMATKLKFLHFNGIGSVTFPNITNPNLLKVVNNAIQSNTALSLGAQRVSLCDGLVTFGTTEQHRIAICNDLIKHSKEFKNQANELKNLKTQFYKLYSWHPINNAQFNELMKHVDKTEIQIRALENSLVILALHHEWQKPLSQAFETYSERKE